MIHEEIAAYLATQSSVTDLIGEWDFGDGAAPAIFTIRPRPDAATNPLLIVMAGPGEPYGTNSASGLRQPVTIEVWGDRNGSDVDVSELSETVWEALDRADITFAGMAWSLIDCNPPERIDDPDGFPGYQITAIVKAIRS